MVYADPGQMSQVLQNLGMNALQAMERSGELTFRTFVAEGRREGGDVVALEIRDTGPGIHPDHLDKVFDPFFTTRDEGTGLGLSISYQIVSEHQGTMEVASRPGEGSTFTIALPAAEGKYRERRDRGLTGRKNCGVL
jgi:signal transduction histidine kinase